MTTTRILLVEDERDIAVLLVHVLNDGGFDADLATNIAEAMKRLAEHRGGYGLVIADWRLADGNGLAVVERAAELGIKTAILTGYAFHVPREVAARHQVWLKPMRPSELIAAVGRSMEKNGA